MNEETRASGYLTTFLYTLGAALVTAALLFFNGGFVMAVLNAVASEGPGWLRDQRFMQFTLFAAPVLLVIVEWMIIDFIRTHLWRSR